MKSDMIEIRRDPYTGSPRPGLLILRWVVSGHAVCGRLVWLPIRIS